MDGPQTPARRVRLTPATPVRLEPSSPVGLKAGHYVLSALFSAILGTLAFAFAILAYAYLMLPDVRPLKTSNPSTTAFIEMRADEARAKGHQPHRVQRWVSYGRVSPDLKRAVLVAEDDAFWQHEGVDLGQLQESIEADWTRGRFVRGGSTIHAAAGEEPVPLAVQDSVAQAAGADHRTPARSGAEKVALLELYLNVIEWGDGVYGVEAAAQTYFHAPAAALGPAESALLAAAIASPRLHNPARPNARLIRRQQLILRRMGAVSPTSGVSST